MTAITARISIGLCLLGLGATSATAASPPPEEISRRASAILDHPSYQKTLPDRGDGSSGTGRGAGRGPAADSGAGERQSTEPTRANREAWGDGTSRPDRSSPRSRAASAEPGAASAGARFFSWLLVGVVMVAAIAWMMREARAGRLRETRFDPLVLPPPATTSAPPSEDEIEALARRHAYGDAVHLLLRRAIGVLGRRRPLAESLTSREVLRTAELQGPARGAFEVLVTAVEKFLFGGVALFREDYERCVEAYRQVIGDSAPQTAAAEDGR